MSGARPGLEALLELMARLRDPVHGCPWDCEQTFATIAPYTLEEAYEVAAAIEEGDPARLREELGDLLFQVVFHARMAEERGWFDFDAVARGIHAKLVRRHPHVFGGSRPGSAAEQSRTWEELKAQERAQASGQPSAGALDGVPLALPALTRAAKLGRRAARVGFDWPDAPAVREKVAEELRELDEALGAAPEAAQAGSDAIAEELGDLLFAVANWARKLERDPEGVLRAANAKFERRFRAMEALARSRGLELRALTPGQWDALWCECKAAPPAEPPASA